MANADFYGIACGNEYTEAATIRDVLGASEGVFEIQDQPSRYRIQFGKYGQDYWTRERIIGTGGGTIPRGAIGIQFRNATPNVVSTVTAVFALQDEPLLSLTFPAAASVSTAQRVSALPSSPSDTQVVVYQPDAVNFPGIEWFCIFNTATGFWDVIGGNPLVAEVQAFEGSASAAYANLATFGPSISLTNAGDWDVEVQGTLENPQGAGPGAFFAAMSYDIGVTPAADADAALFGTGVNGAFNVPGSVVATRRKPGLVVETLVAKYRNSAGTATFFGNRRLRAMPVRIK
jgi:hypothetical protein